jgi:hypothetical protein
MDKLNKNKNVNLDVGRDWERNTVNKEKTVSNSGGNVRKPKKRFDDFDYEFGNDVGKFNTEYERDNYNHEFSNQDNTNMEIGKDNCLNNNKNKFD